MVEFVNLNVEVKILEHLPMQGRITVSSGYHLINLEAGFVDLTFPLIASPHIRKPDHQAHISVIYRDEKGGEVAPLMESINFRLEKLAKLELFEQTYFAWIVSSVKLEKYRTSLGLAPTPIFKGVKVPFHITVARGFPKS